MKTLLFVVVALLVQAPAFASQLACHRVVGAKAEAYLARQELEDVGIHGIEDEERNTYIVEYGFMEECVGSLRVRVRRIPGSCVVVSIKDLGADCG